MEHSNYAPSKRRIPAFICRSHVRRFTETAGERARLTHGQDARDSVQERCSSKKTVTMAPTSTYLTRRSLYTARKPLLHAAEHQTSILKNALAHDCSEQIIVNDVDSNQKESEYLCKNTAPYPLKRTSTPKIITSSPPSFREDLSALYLSDLRLCSSDDDLNFSSVPLTNEHARSISSPASDDTRLTVPKTHDWISTRQTLSHSYAYQTRPLLKTKTFKQNQDTIFSTSSSFSHNKGNSTDFKHMSPYQANYWACAIPRCLPPSPNRKSPSWDPDKEYQALLDYTYPIRPNSVSKSESNECRKPVRTNPLLPDSGIELDSILSSSSLSCSDLHGTESMFGQSLSGFHKLNQSSKLSHSKSSDLQACSSLCSSLEQVGLSLESLDYKEKQSYNCNKHGIVSTSRSAPNFIRSTCILPHPDSLGDWDEDYLRLPTQLQELQDLTYQLNIITEQISQPVKTSWQKFENKSALEVSSATQMEKQPNVSDQQVTEAQMRAEGANFQSRDFSKHLKEINGKLPITSRDLYRGDTREVKDIMDQMKSLSEFQRIEIDESQDETNESLLKNLKVFCTNLEQLIQWLYRMVGKIELVPPTSVDIESVKASLADYESFQMDVQAHRPLTASVLQTGEILLCCLNSASPCLKETLMLIERQSDALENHSEHLFNSILSTLHQLRESHNSTERT